MDAPLYDAEEERMKKEIDMLQRISARNDFMKDANVLMSAHRGEGLITLVSRWGRRDVTRRVLSHQDFIEHRQQRHVQVTAAAL